MSKTYYIVEALNRSLFQIKLDLSGYVTYDTQEEAEGIKSHCTSYGHEAVYRVTESEIIDGNNYTSTLTIKRL
jgi:hypothetical protein